MDHHCSIVITMDRYGHLFPGQDEALADRLDVIGRGMVGVWSEASGSVVRLMASRG
jgi:hypothetical protein